MFIVWVNFKSQNHGSNIIKQFNDREFFKTLQIHKNLFAQEDDTKVFKE